MVISVMRYDPDSSATLLIGRSATACLALTKSLDWRVISQS